MRSSGGTRRPSPTSALWPDCEPETEPSVPAPPEPYGGCVTRNLEALAARGLKFGTVYADPPWAYQNTVARGAAEDHYRTMTLDGIPDLDGSSHDAATTQPPDGGESGGQP